tara:strand:- start:294 stop:530 length:237 start_codon:yes stop_codon:yes gene_type:complete
MLKTINKIRIAKVLSFIFIYIFRFKQKQAVYRHNIKYKLDLKEGIDLSIFIFGSFQKKITNTLLKIIEKNSTKKNFQF